MGRSKYPSIVRMPEAEEPYPTILEFLSQRFPKIDKAIWQERILEGKVLDENQNPISLAFEYVPLEKLYYFREVKDEVKIPFKEKILFETDTLLVVDKPHFLPVTPAGEFVNECLLNRLKEQTGNNEITPMHRIDRATAGVIVLLKQKQYRAPYFDLFMNGQVDKSYKAVSKILSGELPEQDEWLVENRLEPGEPWFRMQVVSGVVNAKSRIKLTKALNNKAFFDLKPLTGKQHQLRIHLSSLGFQILNDRYYPDLEDKRPDDYDKPLQLLAKSISFRDPLSDELLFFETEQTLLEETLVAP